MVASLLFLFYIIVAYLIGSISSAVIISRLFDLPDPRKEGSKNPGTTNVLRLAGKQYAAIVLFVDILKGFLPVLLAVMLKAGPIAVGFTCFAAVLGHMYPVFFKFEGGKGVATAMGALLALNFMLGVVVIATWLLVANLTHYSSAASIISMLLAPLYSLFAFGNPSVFLPIMCISFAILYKHRDNITRLMDGKEPKINFSYKGSLNKTHALKHSPKLKTATKQSATATKTSKVAAKTSNAAVKTSKATAKTSKAAVKTSKTAVKTSKAAPKVSKPATLKKTATAKNNSPQKPT